MSGPQSSPTISIDRRKREIEDAHGRWTAHNVRLAEDVYTLAPHLSGNELRARRMLQVVADAARAPLEGLRILDLGCLEGLFALEFALHGAEVVGMEAREGNIAKARFAQDCLGLRNVTFLQEDVRDLSSERHGTFDVVLCLGLLYHLDAPDVFEFLARLSEVTRGFLVLDTHIAPAANVRVEHGGVVHAGRRIVEHRTSSTQDQRLELLWASLDNPESFWPTRPTLVNDLARAGFTSVTEILHPGVPEQPVDRVEWIAFKGERQHLRSSPLADSLAFSSWPETSTRTRSKQLRWDYRLRFLLSEAIRALPAPVKRVARSVMGRRPRS